MLGSQRWNGSQAMRDWHPRVEGRSALGASVACRACVPNTGQDLFGSNRLCPDCLLRFEQLRARRTTRPLAAPPPGQILLSVLLAVGTLVSTLVAYKILDQSPQSPAPFRFRLECARVDTHPGGFTFQVATAEHAVSGTTYTIKYGDGESDGSAGLSRAKLTHTYRRHGRYQVTAEVDAPGEEPRTYLGECRV